MGRSRFMADGQSVGSGANNNSNNNRTRNRSMNTNINRNRNTNNRNDPHVQRHRQQHRQHVIVPGSSLASVSTQAAGVSSRSTSNTFRQENTERDAQPDDISSVLTMETPRSWLRQVETALSVRFMTKSRQQFSVTFDEFYDLVRKLPLERPGTTDQRSHDDQPTTKPTTTDTDKKQTTHQTQDVSIARKAPSQPTTLSSSSKSKHGLHREERILLDFLTVASPTLYRIKGRHQLEPVSFTGNRLEELFRLFGQYQNDGEVQKKSSSRQTILQTIQEARAERIQREQSFQKASLAGSKRSFAATSTHSQTTATTTSVSSLLVGTSTSVEDRVRAKAAAREARSASSATSTTLSGSASDRAALVRLADAIWAHSKQIWDHQQRLRGDAAPQQQTRRPCTMTLQDAVRIFSQVYSSTGTRKQFLNGLRDLQAAASSFLEFSDDLFQKESTVWIKPIDDYQALRRRLSGKREQTGGQNGKETNALKMDARTPSSSSSSPAAATTTTAAAPKVRTKPGYLSTLVSKIKQTNSGSSDRNGKSNGTDMQGSQQTKKQRVSVDLAGRKRSFSQVNTVDALTNSRNIPKTGFSNSNHHQNGHRSRGNQQEEDEEQQEEQQQDEDDDDILPQRKKKRGLRINHHLILTDADYTGGQIIQPSSDSPRLLRQLFLRLCRGQRI